MDEPETVNAGTSSSFTIEVTNNGPSDADAVLISDDVDGRLQVTSVSALGDPADVGSDANLDANSQTIRWLLPKLSVGESVTLTVEFDVAPEQGVASIDNVAIATDDDGNTDTGSARSPWLHRAQ